MRTLSIIVFWLAASSLSAADPTNPFGRNILPILSDKCFACHGPDAKERKADLRLDTREGVLQAVDLANVSASELLRRITTKDPDEVMPPPSSHKEALTPDQVTTLTEWVSSGVVWGKHWAFEKPVKSAVPIGENPIDWFVAKRLAEMGWRLSEPAPAETWLRRVTLDLHGLPPNPDEVRDFLEDVAVRGEIAYSQAADRLMKSPRFGERMAQEWLDAARYADTHGFNNDSARSMWRWRDWVIDAFNDNLPYDRFITEQLAGDLLPNATLEQRIATGFCRNHVINSEGGIIDEEYRVEYVADRVRTMSTAWLGLTMECSRCHDHKFDPITQNDYYSLFAFFNNVPEHGEDGRVANAVPLMAAPTRQQQKTLALLLTRVQELDAKLDEMRTNLASSNEASQRDAGLVVRGAETQQGSPNPNGATDPTENEPKVLLHVDCESAEPIPKVLKFPNEKPTLVDGIRGQAWHSTSGALAEIESGKLDFGTTLTVAFWIRPDADNPRDVALLSGVSYDGKLEQQGYARGHEIRLIDGEIEIRTNEYFPAYAIRVRSEGAGIRSDKWQHVAIISGGTRQASDLRVFVNGAELTTTILYDGISNKSIGAKSPYSIGADRSKMAVAYRGALDEWYAYAMALSTKDVVNRILKDTEHNPEAARSEGSGHAKGALRGGWAGALDMRLRRGEQRYASLAAQRDSQWEEYLKLRRSLPTTMVMQELETPRATFVLQRGAYDAPTVRVEPRVPESLLGAWPEGVPRNRLGLARWLTQKDHPLTSRVVVNRFWAQLFGTGIVKTLEDFGAQGEYPSHPELLDWLACDFVENQWNVKALLRKIVLSRTYRQSSVSTSELNARDPENRLLGRAPRLRLSAESLRDQALALSGLFKDRIGGPSVYPYQPEGLYSGLVVGADYPGTKWEQSQGDDLYRRSMYTFWKRTVPHPVMLTFDAPDREFCSVRRGRTNTPLQALILMNEPTFVEAAQKLGERMKREGGESWSEQITWAFRLVTARTPRPEEHQQLVLAMDQAHRSNAVTAYAVFASILLNLDEVITRE